MNTTRQDLFVFILVFILWVLVFAGCSHADDQQFDFTEARMKMVETQIMARGIKEERVLNAMRKVERHRFVPTQYQTLAYSDRPLPIGEGQTISQPYIVAFMTEKLNLQKNEKVLEIGTGSGYQAAILSEISDSVYSIEINQKLAEFARRNLTEAGYTSVKLKAGDGYLGWPEEAPFHAVIVTCAPSDVPKPLQDQLAEGGRMIIPVDASFGQELILLRKIEGKLVRSEVLPVRFVPMIDSDGKRY